jgi:hypothetical protein
VHFHFFFTFKDLDLTILDGLIVVLGLFFEGFDLDFGRARYIVLFYQSSFCELEVRSGGVEFFSLLFKSLPGPVQPGVEVGDVRLGLGGLESRNASLFLVALRCEHFGVAFGDLQLSFGLRDVELDLLNLVDDLVSSVDRDVELIFSVEQKQFVFDGDLLQDFLVDAEAWSGSASTEQTKCKRQQNRFRKVRAEPRIRRQQNPFVDQNAESPMSELFQHAEEATIARMSMQCPKWRIFPAIFFLVASAACGDSEDPPPTSSACDEMTPPSVFPLEVDVPKRGTVKVRDLRLRTLDPEGRAQDALTGRVTAQFGDFSSVTSTPAAEIPLSLLCVGVVSRPGREGDVGRLGMESVQIEGTARGTIRATQTSTGVFVDVGSAVIDGADASLRIVAVGGPAPGFVSFDETLTSPLPMEVLAPPLEGTSLVFGPLEVRWVPGNGDFVSIELFPEGPGGASGGQVACVVRDDGCFVLPEAASAFVLGSGSDTYSLRVGRFNYRAFGAGVDTFFDLSASSEWRQTLESEK